jgi:hypothetical protein
LHIIAYNGSAFLSYSSSVPKEKNITSVGRSAAETDSGFVGPQAYTIFLGGGLFKKNHEYKIRYEREYLFRMRK